MCNFVTEEEIISVLKKGATSTEEIQEYTRAGTSCGKCLPVIDHIVENFLSRQPDDPQAKIDFG
jgi:nitrite reductase (NADH) large subunit